MGTCKVVKGPVLDQSGARTSVEVDRLGIEVRIYADSAGQWFAVLRPAVNPPAVSSWDPKTTKLEAFQEAASAWDFWKLPTVDWASVTAELTRVGAL
jgi:hypothetical protein